MDFSFIIPAHNAGATIGSCLESIKSQNCKKEIIVICDSSTDQTFNVAKKYADIKVYSVNFCSAAMARNFGAKHSQGDYLVFVDADVVLNGNWIETMSKHLPQYDVLIGGQDKPDEVALNLSNFRPPAHFMLVKKDAFQAVNGYRESFKYSGGEDADLLIRLLKKNFKVFYENVSFEHYETNNFKKSIFRAYANLKMNALHLDIPLCWFWLLRKVSGLVIIVALYKRLKNKQPGSTI